MKIKIRNNLSGDAKQIEFLPSLDLFWDKGVVCISIGWLIIIIEIWFGKTDWLI